MDAGLIVGLVALAVSCLSWGQGWLSDNAINKRLDAIDKATNRHADHIDGLIELNRSNHEETGKWLAILDRVWPGGDA